MNVKESLEALRLKMQQKNLVFVTNNVHDVFLKQQKSRNLITIIDEIKNVAFKDLKHKSAIYYSFGKGIEVFINKDLQEDTEENQEPEKEVEKLVSFNDFIEHIKANLEDNSKDKKYETYIIDFVDFMLDKDNKNDEIFTKLLEIIALLLTSQNEKYSQLANNKKQSKFIFVMRDAGNVVNYITNKNIEYSEILIGKPDSEERKDFLTRIAYWFQVSDYEQLREKDSKTQIEAIVLTEGMSYREILQLARIESDSEEISFKELYYLSTIRDRSSPWEKLNPERFLKIPNYLNEQVFGQEYAVSHVSKTLKRAFVGLSSPFQGSDSNKPKGVLFFCGPTGVGKTEMAKSITKFIFGEERRMIRFDMSEFAQEHSDQRLLGSPPGYVGFDSGGELTNKVKENPNSLLLFDEIEKAHPRILDKFLQILEDGRLTSSKGELINFAETFIIFTSNIGSAKAMELIEKLEGKEGLEQRVRQIFLGAVYEHFEGTGKDKGQLGRPEILNRIGRENIIPFNFITDKDIKVKMLASKIEKLKEIIKAKHQIVVEIDGFNIEELVDAIEDDPLYQEKDGARGMLAIATRLIVDELVDYLISNKANSKNSKKVEMYIQKDKVHFKQIA